MAKISLSPLPYAMDALTPHISKETLQYHFGKHHKTYVDTLNKLIEGTEFADMELEAIIGKSSSPIFNNAAQAWNHAFYWHCLAPKGGGAPDGQLAEAIDRVWGPIDTFKSEFTKAAASNFGSGWTWLVQNRDGGLEIVNTSNAQTPLTNDARPLLTCDVWEHAYYIDYRNKRADYLAAFWEVVNWRFAANNLAAGAAEETQRARKAG